MEFLTVNLVVGHNYCRQEKNVSPNLAKVVEEMKTDPNQNPHGNFEGFLSIEIAGLDPDL